MEDGGKGRGEGEDREGEGVGEEGTVLRMLYNCVKRVMVGIHRGTEEVEGKPRSQASTASFCRLQYEKQVTKAGCGGLGTRLLESLVHITEEW